MLGLLCFEAGCWLGAVTLNFGYLAVGYHGLVLRHCGHFVGSVVYAGGWGGDVLAGLSRVGGRKGEGASSQAFSNAHVVIDLNRLSVRLRWEGVPRSGRESVSVVLGYQV